MENQIESCSSPSQLHEKLSALGDSGYDLAACERYSQMIGEIFRLKAERHAVILAHNYQRPEIFEVADFIGDSLELARQAKHTSGAEIIVFCGVHFMAETAKVLNPATTVLLPDLKAGCSLADSVTAEALEEKRAQLLGLYPDLKVVSYVNTPAEVKAVSDACCTSANAVAVVEAIDSEHILFVPDRNLANYVQGRTGKQIISWDGDCYVHHQITPAEIQKVKDAIPGITVLAHPECRADVLRLADAVLSTSAMVGYARASSAEKFLVVTECGLSERLIMELPHKRFYKACKLCRFMKMITLGGTLDSLRNLRFEIDLPTEVQTGARRALERMLELSV